MDEHSVINHTRRWISSLVIGLNLCPFAKRVFDAGLIRYVVTEYGVAYLHGKSIRERAKALIDIAHPKFREQLYDYCEHTKWLQRPQAKEAVSTR